MTFSGAATARMPRIIIANVRTGEGYEMPFVPERLEERLAAVRARIDIFGLPHQRRQYRGTSNHTISGLEFFFRGTTEAEVANIHNGRRFLLSLMYPSETADSVDNGGTPRILFVWPQLFSMTCELDTITITHEKFNSQGLTTVFRARLDFEEVRDVRLSSEEVRAVGTIRSGSAPQSTES